MANLRDFVRRWRPAAAPGAAAPAGVPADRGAELMAELAPVLEGLQDAEREAAWLMEAARVEENARRARAGVRSEEILADARQEAEVARSAAAAAALDVASAEQAAARVAARQEAERIEAIARERLPAVLEQVLAQVRALGTEYGAAP